GALPQRGVFRRPVGATALGALANLCAAGDHSRRCWLAAVRTAGPRPVLAAEPAPDCAVHPAGDRASGPDQRLSSRGPTGTVGRSAGRAVLGRWLGRVDRHDAGWPDGGGATTALSHADYGTARPDADDGRSADRARAARARRADDAYRACCRVRGDRAGKHVAASRGLLVYVWALRSVGGAAVWRGNGRARHRRDRYVDLGAASHRGRAIQPQLGARDKTDQPGY